MNVKNIEIMKNNSIEKEVKILGQIYLITNLINNKYYVGQTRTHVMNHGKYRPYGYIKRFNDHISEAIRDTKEKQCTHLNAAIKLYGKENFIVELLYHCELDELNEYEVFSISWFDSFNSGYNLTLGGQDAKMTDEIRQKLSNATTEYFTNDDNKKIHSKLQGIMSDKNKVKYLANLEYDLLNICDSKSTNYKVVIKIIKNNKILEKILFCGSHVTLEIATIRAMWISMHQTKTVTFNGFTREFLEMCRSKVDTFYEEAPPKPKKVVERVRPDSYKKLNVENRMNRIGDIQIVKITVSKRHASQGYDVIETTINPDVEKIKFTFGGKHEGFEYYCREFINFVKNIYEKYNVNNDVIYIPEKTKTFIQSLDVKHPLKLL